MKWPTSFNETKTKCVLISNRNINTYGSLHLNEKISWQSHVTDFITNAKKMLGLVRKILLTE